MKRRHLLILYLAQQSGADFFVKNIHHKKMRLKKNLSTKTKS